MTIRHQAGRAAAPLTWPFPFPLPAALPLPFLLGCPLEAGRAWPFPLPVSAARRAPFVITRALGRRRMRLAAKVCRCVATITVVPLAAASSSTWATVAAVVAQAAAPPPVESTSAHPELARVRPQLAVNEAKKCRLAGTAWARYLYQLTGGNAEVDALENGLATERFGDVDEFDRRLDRDLAVGPRAAPDRPVLLPRVRALNVGAVPGRAIAASCHWSASHPSGPD